MPHQPPTLAPAIEVRTHDQAALAKRLAPLEAFALRGDPVLPLSLHPGCALAVTRGLRQTPYCLEAVEGERTRGFLPLAYVRSLLFGRFLVGLPYVNYGGVQSDGEEVTRLLIDQAVKLADQLRVRYLELRSEHAVTHPALAHARTDKVHMRLDLPADPERLMKDLDGKVRNQVRKGQKSSLTAAWGRHELLPEFYAVFSRNMRDLGTPVYGKALFRCLLDQFPDRTEFCVVRAGTTPVAAALLFHGWGVTEVPSASHLRQYNSTCANMLLYWHLLERAIQRGQDIFDFGRSSKDSSTFRFKKQWGATPWPAEWQYYLRTGSVGEMSPTNGRYQRFIRIWQKLPLVLTRWLGPLIVRGIP